MTDPFSHIPQDAVEVVKLSVAVVCLAIAVSIWRRSRRNGKNAILVPLLLSAALTGCSADLINATFRLGPLGVDAKLTVRDLASSPAPTTQPAAPPGPTP